MASLKEVRNRIVSVGSTQQITKAMKMVAAAKLRRAQDNILRMRPYAQRLNSILTNLSSVSGEAGSNVYAQKRDVQRVLIIAVTSDRGLCGAFNTNVNKYAERFARDHRNQFEKIDFLFVGRKAAVCQREEHIVHIAVLKFKVGNERLVFAQQQHGAPGVFWMHQ